MQHAARGDGLTVEAMHMPAIAEYLVRVLITLLVLVLAVETVAAAFVVMRDLFQGRHHHVHGRHHRAGDPGATPA